MDQETLERFVKLEMLCAHLQHDIEQMHDVLLAVQNDMKALRRDLEKLQSQVSTFDQDDEGIDPASERPPHY